jgi:hypothetical protein
MVVVGILILISTISFHHTTMAFFFRVTFLFVARWWVVSVRKCNQRSLNEDINNIWFIQLKRIAKNEWIEYVSRFRSGVKFVNKLKGLENGREINYKLISYKKNHLKNKRPSRDLNPGPLD